MDFEIRHKHQLDAQAFWNDVFFSEEYNRRLYKEYLGFPTFEVLSHQTLPDGKVERKTLLEPRADAPAVVRKLVGNRVQYREEGVFNPTSGRWKYTVTPNVLADKVNIYGEIWVEPAAHGSVERVCRGTVDVKVFGVGRTVEKFIVDTTKRDYDRAAQFTNTYISALPES